MDRLSFQDQFRLEGTGRRQPRSEVAGGTGRGRKRRNSEACEGNRRINRVCGVHLCAPEPPELWESSQSERRIHRSQPGKYRCCRKAIGEIGDDLKVSIVNSPDAGAYPIASFTWFVVPAHILNELRNGMRLQFSEVDVGARSDTGRRSRISCTPDFCHREESCARQNSTAIVTDQSLFHPARRRPVRSQQ